MSEILKSENVFFKLQLQEGYLLNIIGDNNYEISHENGNGIIKFNSRQSLIEYALQIQDVFEIVDQNGISHE